MQQQEQDPFYSNLPFTLPPQQCQPPHVILGTGLQQCLIAAHYAKVHRQAGLVLDCEKTYGAAIRTLTLKELYALGAGKEKLGVYRFLGTGWEQANQEWMNGVVEAKEWKGYNIDIEPSYFFASSATCELLKQADMDKYMDFRIVVNMLHYTPAHGLTSVPLSKGKIFSSKTLSLVQKKLLLSTLHSLMQLHNKHTKKALNQNSTDQFDKEFGQVDQKLYQQFLENKDAYFLPFLQKITKNNTRILDFVVFVLANLQYDYRQNGKWVPTYDLNEWRLQRFLDRVGRFVRSCGVYGETPYLYVDNGIGDVPQAYSRIASIYLSIYILHPKIELNKIQVTHPQPTQELEKPKQQPTSETPEQSAEEPPTPQFSIHTNLSPTTPIKTPKLYISPSYYHLAYTSPDDYYCEYTLRTIMLCDKLGNQEECPAIVYLTDVNRGEHDGQANPVFLFVFDHVSHSCPQGKIMYQFEEVIGQTVQPDYQCKPKIQQYIQILQKCRGNQFTNSIKYLTSYIRQKRYPKQVPTSTTSPQMIVLRDHSGIDLDSEFLNFKNVVGDQPSYFRVEKQPGQEIGDDDFDADDTVGLIQRLNAIDIKTEEVQQPTHETEKCEQIPKNKQKVENTEVKNQQEDQNSEAKQQQKMENIQPEPSTSEQAQQQQHQVETAQTTEQDPL